MQCLTFFTFIAYSIFTIFNVYHNSYVIVAGDFNVDLLQPSGIQAEYVNLFTDF